MHLGVKEMHNMKKWFIIVLCFMMMFFSGCGFNPDRILQKEDIVSEADMEAEEDITGFIEDNPANGEESVLSLEKSTSDSNQIFAYICGAVKAPGVYALSSDSRIFQLVEKAGGLTEDADDQSVNLAEPVEDGQMVRISTMEERNIGEAASAGDSRISAESGITNDGKVNINKATVEELTSLNGIGETRAASIITYRESHGSFKSIEEIMQVDGIAQGTYDKIKDSITV